MLRRTLLAVLGTAGAGGVVFREELIEWVDGGDETGEASVTAGGEIETRGESDGAGGDSEAAFEPAAVEAAIVDRINDARFQAGVENLGRDATLRRAARRHSRDMHEREFYAHRNPDGQEPWHRVPCEAGETIHEGFLPRAENVDGERVWNTSEVSGAAAYVVEGWTLSREHYAIMIDDLFERVGVGVVEEDGRFLVTAKYC